MLRWIIFISLLITAAIAGYFYVQTEKNGGTPPQILPNQSTSKTPGAIHVEHAYKDGVHKFSGKIRLPHSCYTVRPEAVVSTDLTEVTLQLTTDDHITDLKICTQITSSFPFETIAEAAEHITLHVKVNGKEVPSDMTDVAWQTINEVEHR